jgi:hypothetical protein
MEATRSWLLVGIPPLIAGNEDMRGERGELIFGLVSERCWSAGKLEC